MIPKASGREQESVPDATRGGCFIGIIGIRGERNFLTEPRLLIAIAANVTRELLGNHRKKKAEYSRPRGRKERAMSNNRGKPCGECGWWKSGFCSINGFHDRIGKRDTRFCGGFKVPDKIPEGERKEQ